jgi:uncharacterized protein YkwD
MGGFRAGKIRARGAKVGAAVGVALLLGGCAWLESLSRSSVPEPERLPANVVAYSETEALTWVNAYRASLGLGAVVIDPMLNGIAVFQALGMAAADSMDHHIVGGLGERMGGYPFLIAAENIAAGQKTVGVVLEDWRQSPSHDEHLRDPRIKAIGLAAAAVLDPTLSRYDIYWAMVMAEPYGR